MGFFDRFKTRDEPQVTPPMTDALLSALMNGETITREKALTLPAVSGAVDLICNTVACMPVKLYKYKKGQVEEVEGDNRVALLNGDTGDTLDAFQFKKAMVEDYLLGKGGYAYIEKDRNDVVALRYVEEIYITILKNFKPIYKDYQILVEGEAYYPCDFIKLLRNTKDGASGVGLTVEVSKALETAYQTLLYQLGMVKSGGNKKGFLKSQRKLGQDEIDVLKKAWRRLYANNEENVVVLNNGLEFQEASNSSVEMQLNESKRTLQDEINHLFHISDNFELFFKEAIYPIIKAFETALNRDLLLEKEKKSLFFEFDVKEIIKANITERYNAYKTAKETGFMTLNEIRRMENMNYVEGLDVVNVGLGAVLYDTDTHQYFTPNTGETVDLQKEENMLEGHVMEEEFKESGNSSDA
jgi:HK97 family phage portal protein